MSLIKKTGHLVRRIKSAEVCLVQLETFRKITLFQCTIQSFSSDTPCLIGLSLSHKCS